MAEEQKQEQRDAPEAKREGDSQPESKRIEAGKPEPTAKVAEQAKQDQPEQRTWTPTTENDQMTIVHAALLQSHVQALVQSVATGAPSSVRQIHSDAIKDLAGKLADHVDSKAEQDKAAKDAADQAVASKTLAAASKPSFNWAAWVGPVIGVLGVALYWAHVKGLV